MTLLFESFNPISSAEAAVGFFTKVMIRPKLAITFHRKKSGKDHSHIGQTHQELGRRWCGGGGQ
jgi:hypothetical protein